MTKREQRVINAFLNCIRHGDYTEDYAITLIEDQTRYGWLSDTAKDYFYEELDKMHPVEPEPVEETPTEETEPTEVS
jgi:hypothetical protein